MNTPLSTFPAPLLRPILCGGGGLAPAWGPLYHIGTHEADRYPWDPTTQRASGLPGYLYDDGSRIECWSLPLDAESPWPARLALVAAWMLRRLMKGAPELSVIDVDADVLFLTGICGMAGWRIATGSDDPDLCFYAAPNLPTLPQHLQTHPPAVALLLALYDVPEITARVEAP